MPKPLIWTDEMNAEWDRRGEAYARAYEKDFDRRNPDWSKRFGELPSRVPFKDRPVWTPPEGNVPSMEGWADPMRKLDPIDSRANEKDERAWQEMTERYQESARQAQKLLKK